MTEQNTIHITYWKKIIKLQIKAHTVLPAKTTNTLGWGANVVAG